MRRLSGMLVLLVLAFGCQTHDQDLDSENVLLEEKALSQNPPGPKFLTLPVADPDISNGWYYSGGSLHYATDYSGVQGDNVFAACDGNAIRAFSGTDNGYGYYGNYVLIYCDQTDNSGKHYMIVNAHLYKAAENIEYRDSNSRFDTDYENWTPVVKGEVIGQMGSSGTSWTHLHFEVFTGDYAYKANNRIDPYDIYNLPANYPPQGSCGQNYLWETCPPQSEFLVSWHPQGTLLKTVDSTKVYLRNSGNQIRWIKNEDVFDSYNFDWSRIITVTNYELGCYELGADINDFPNLIPFYTDFTPCEPAWIKFENSGGCTRQNAHVETVLNSWGFDARDTVYGSEADQMYDECVEVPNDLYFRPGSLIKCKEDIWGYDKSTVFVAEENGTMRPIFNGEVFEMLGFNWDDIIEVSYADFYTGYYNILDTIDYSDLQQCQNQGGSTAGIAVSPECEENDTMSCYSGDISEIDVGECRAGEQQCLNGSWSVCAHEVLPQIEINDGLDNDCDGEVDEGFSEFNPECNFNSDCEFGFNCEQQTGQCVEIPGIRCTSDIDCPADFYCYLRDGMCVEIEVNIIDYQCEDGDLEDCYTGPADTQGRGICRIGYKHCENGTWSECFNETTPEIEVYDGVDNDCDGQVDEGFTQEEGVNVLCNSDFEQGETCWQLEDHNNAGTVEIDCTSSYTGSCSAKVSNTQTDIYYSLQFKQHFEIEAGQHYVLSFAAKADNNSRPVEVEVVQNHAPWSVCDLINTVWLDTDWQEYSFEFQGTVDDPDFKMTFHLADSLDTVWFDNVLLTKQ